MLSRLLSLQRSMNSQSKICRSVVKTTPSLCEDKIQVTFLKSNGEKIKAFGKTGDSLLDVVLNNDIDIEGFGACEGVITCSTCHLIFAKEDYDRLTNPKSDEENDMLDLAHDLTPTSRLGCQIKLTRDLNGIEIRVPKTVSDLRNLDS